MLSDMSRATGMSRHQSYSCPTSTRAYPTSISCTLERGLASGFDLTSKDFSKRSRVENLTHIFKPQSTPQNDQLDELNSKYIHPGPKKSGLEAMEKSSRKH